MQKTVLSGGVLGLLISAALIMASPAQAAFPASTNANNISNNWAHVTQTTVGPGTTTLQFVSTRAFWSCFEYRTDGDTSQALASANPNSELTDRYPHLCINNNTTTKDFVAANYVEIRMAFGAEADERFDWTRFDVEQAPSASPTPSVTPSATPAPAKTNVEHSSLYVETLACGQADFRTEMDLKNGNNPLQDVLVVFTYNGISKNAYTNKDGRAATSFTFTGEAVVKATPNNGFATQESKVSAQTNCQTVNTPSVSMSTPASSGQVLGASTYAETGVFADVLMSIVGLSGATMTSVGAMLHAKKKN